MVLMAFLSPPKDIEALAEKIMKLINDENLRIRMGENGRKMVENKFTWDRTTSKTLELFEQL